MVAKKKAVRDRPAPVSTRAAPARVRGSPQPADNRNLKYEMTYQDIHSLKAYDFNPRDNAAAVDSVAASIKLVGFIMPVVVDRNNVLVAGHTRIEAAKKLGLSEAPAIYADSLTEEQLNAFRLIDNKVSELAKWDFDMLAGEIQKLGESGINLTEFGWSREELDCLTDVVAGDCLDSGGLIDLESQERRDREQRRAPATARFVLGELVFFLPATVYREWVDTLRTEFDFNETHIITELKRRLGVPT